jgi:hypothetical protein
MSIASPLRSGIFSWYAALGCLFAAFDVRSTEAQPPSRVWTDSTGKFKREASFERLDGESVVLRAADGQELSIPLERLSAVDRAYAKTIGEEASADDPFSSLKAPSTDAIQEGRENSVAGGAVRVIIAKGVGKTVEEAKKDAYREAVRQVVGAYVEADTLTRNDELIEDKVIALSGAFVESASVVPDSLATENGITQVSVRAEVKVTEVLKQLGRLASTRQSISGADLAAQQLTLSDQAEASTALLSDEKTWRLFPAQFFRLAIKDAPRLNAAKDSAARISYSVALEPDLVAYLSFARRLLAVLEKKERRHGTFANNGLRPKCDPDYIQQVQAQLLQEMGARSETGLAACFRDQKDSEAFLKSLGNASQPAHAKSSLKVFCFDQGGYSNPDECGLDSVGKDWAAVWGEKTGDALCVCLLAESNNGCSQTKWAWFECDREEFPTGDLSPWCRGLECRITFLDGNGDVVISDSFVLGSHREHGSVRDFAGWGVHKTAAQLAFISPFFVEPYESGELHDRKGYVSSMVTARHLYLDVDDLSRIVESKCEVLPIVCRAEDR